MSEHHSMQQHWRLDDEQSDNGIEHWNPLLDGNDALKLAVHFNARLDFNGIALCDIWHNGKCYSGQSEHPDKDRAARECVVIAVAQIGLTML